MFIRISDGLTFILEKEIIFDGNQTAPKSRMEEAADQVAAETERVLKRTRRGHWDHGHGKGVTGPVHTYIKTDYHGNFKWGAKHTVGKHMRYG